MNLKEAIQLGYSASWYTDEFIIENTKSVVNRIHIHRGLAKISGAFRYQFTFTYCTPDYGEHIVTFTACSSASEILLYPPDKFPGLNLEEEGWCWHEGYENVVKSKFNHLGEILVKFEKDCRRPASRVLVFKDSEIEVLKNVTFVTKGSSVERPKTAEVNIRELYRIVRSYRAFMEATIDGWVHDPDSDDDYDPVGIGDAWYDFSSGLIDDKVYNPQYDLYHEAFEYHLMRLRDAGVIKEEAEEKLTTAFRSLMEYSCDPASYQKWYELMVHTLQEIFSQEDKRGISVT